LFFLTAVSFIASISPKGSHGRFVGTFQGLEWVGNISGSIIGGFVAESTGTRTVFLFAALIQASGATTVIWLRRKGAESARKTEVTEEASKSSWAELLKMPPVYVASCAIFFIMFGYQGLVNTILPIYVTFELDFSLVFVGVLAMCLSVGQTIAMFVGGELADRLGYRKVLAIAMALSAALSPMFSHFRAMGQLIILSVVFGVTRGIGLTVPIALIGSEVGPMQVASAVAVYRTLMDIGGVVGPSVLAASTEVYGYSAGFMLAGLVMVVPLTLLARLRPSQERQDSAV
jgi:MFS family permease